MGTTNVVCSSTANWRSDAWYNKCSASYRRRYLYHTGQTVGRRSADNEKDFIVVADITYEREVSSDEDTDMIQGEILYQLETAVNNSDTLSGTVKLEEIDIQDGLDLSTVDIDT